MAKKVVLVLVVVAFLLGFVAALPSTALGESPDISRLIPFIRMGGGTPSLFDGQSTGKGMLFAYDLGVNSQQVGIIFGYGLQYGALSSGEWTIDDSGAISGGGCAIAVLMPGFYPEFTILDGRYEIYNLPGIQQDSWTKKLVSERVQEQTAHYGCTYTLSDVQIWNQDGTASPLSSARLAATTATAAPAATTVAYATTAAPAATAPAAERRISGANQSIPFSEGESVYGWRIVLDNGFGCDGGECYLPSAPVGGTVTSGVVNPWKEEIPTNTTPWSGTANRPSG